MTTHAPRASNGTSADLDTARLLLSRMGLSAEDLMLTPTVRPPVPTFAEYIPVVSAAVTDGTRRVDGSYCNRILDHWGHRHLAGGSARAEPVLRTEVWMRPGVDSEGDHFSGI